jgi:hypothetical protein
MAQDAYLTDNPEALDIARQRKLAEMLTLKAFEQPQGQMISGHYVAPSFTQQLAPLVSGIAGQAMGSKLDEKQLKLAEALRAKKDAVQEKISEAIKSGDTKLALSIASKNPEYAKEYIAPLIGNIVPKAPEIMSEKDKEDIRIREKQLQVMSEHYKQMASQQGASLANSRVPMGYRMTSSGGLEAIPGGPADIKAQTVDVGKQTVNTIIGGLKDEYSKLLSKGGITSTAQPGISNIPAAIGSSGIGQMTGKLLGTENQSARNTIAQSRPLLLQAIKSATGMSAKQMDSNVELKMYLAAATDPTLDYETNIKALNQLEALYGGKQQESNKPKFLGFE